tara:strand:- start:621 stop:866 length:246 start_codon:yes stop_codon:yes gene_type:complete
MSAHNVYLEQFYENPRHLEEYKINFLKNHYYDRIANILMIERKNLLIGVTKNKNFIYFKSNKPKSKPVILDRYMDRFIHFD